jgi:hypothetical protein
MILQAGDVVHLVLPGEPHNTEKSVIDAIRNWYASYGVQVGLFTHSAGNSAMQVIVIRGYKGTFRPLES